MLGSSGTAGSKARVKTKKTKPTKRKHKVHFFLGWTTGLSWWHHYAPPVVGTMNGTIGLSWNWFEVALLVGSPAWGRWGARGLYEFGIMVGLRSLRWGRLALIHRFGLGLVCHNPSFGFHSMSARLAPVVVAYRLWRGAWIEGSAVTLTVLQLDQFESTVGFRYEF